MNLLKRLFARGNKPSDDDELPLESCEGSADIKIIESADGKKLMLESDGSVTLICGNLQIGQLGVGGALILRLKEGPVALAFPFMERHQLDDMIVALQEAAKRASFKE